jgi:hypothetical protein
MWYYILKTCAAFFGESGVDYNHVLNVLQYIVCQVTFANVVAKQMFKDMYNMYHLKSMCIYVPKEIFAKTEKK